jgi:aryl-alcohol dehydrogenase-like predicted oxidoreductase
MTDRAFDAGVNFFDTADGYSGGESEVYLGKFLGPRRKDVLVATKVGFRSGEATTQAGPSRRHIFEECDSSLKSWARIGSIFISFIKWMFSRQ